MKAAPGTGPPSLFSVLAGDHDIGTGPTPAARSTAARRIGRQAIIRCRVRMKAWCRHPRPHDTVSVPGPPLKRSFPGPPDRSSFPVPPASLSFLMPPVCSSWPGPPLRMRGNLAHARCGPATASSDPETPIRSFPPKERSSTRSTPKRSMFGWPSPLVSMTSEELDPSTSLSRTRGRPPACPGSARRRDRPPDRCSSPSNGESFHPARPGRSGRHRPQWSHRC
jgi:hypothetical protein